MPVVGASFTIEAKFLDSGEAPVDAGSVSVVVTDVLGTVVTGVGTPTPDTNHVYHATVPAQAAPHLLTAVWTSATHGTVTTTADVAGGAYFGLDELRALRNVDTAIYSTADLDAARRHAEAVIESECGRSFVPRFAIDRFHWGEPAILSHRDATDLVAVLVDDVVQDVSAYQLFVGSVRWVGPGNMMSPIGSSTIKIAYVHGLSAPPADLASAALSLARDWLLSRNSGAVDRRWKLQTDAGFEYISQPGANRPTGIPAVDAVINRYAVRVPGIA